LNTVIATGLAGGSVVVVVVGVLTVSTAVGVEPHPTVSEASTTTSSRRNLIGAQFWQRAVYPCVVSLFGVVLLIAAVALVVAAEWPRLGKRTGLDETRRRERKRQKSHLRVVETETDDFARSVERDLANLPTIDPRERKN
jgi:hypothetical protein